MNVSTRTKRRLLEYKRPDLLDQTSNRLHPTSSLVQSLFIFRPSTYVQVVVSGLVDDISDHVIGVNREEHKHRSMPKHKDAS